MSIFDDSDEASTPANPTSGRKRLYHKSDGLYVLNSAGVEAKLESTANKDATGGYAGLDGFAIKLKNAAGTITSLISSAATTARAWVMPDKDGTVAMLSDISSVSTASGSDFYFDNTVIIPAGTGPQTVPVETLSSTPSTAAEEIQSVSVTNQTLMIADAYMDGPLSSTSIPAGQWEFHLYRYVSATAGTTEILPSIYTNHLETGTITITGTGTSRTATVTGGTPFVSGDADALMEKCSWIQTPNAQMRITAFTSSSVVTVECLSTYTNETGVAFYKDTYRFNTTTGDIGETVVTEEVIPYFLGSPITIVATDRLVCRMFAKTDSLSAKTVYFVYGGTSAYSHFHTTVTPRHNSFSGLDYASAGHTGFQPTISFGTGVQTAIGVAAGANGGFALQTTTPKIINIGSGIVGVPSSGSFANNGVLTLDTAMPTGVAAAYLYFPASAIFAGSSAGRYYATGSGTAWTVYNNTYTGGAISYPGSPTAFVCTGSGAYVQTTAADIEVISNTIPANAMGATGTVWYSPTLITPATTNTKVFAINFGASLVAARTHNTTALAVAHCMAFVKNISTGAQISQRSPITGSAGTAFPYFTAEDTTASKDIKFIVNISNAADYALVFCGDLLVYPS